MNTTFDHERLDVYQVSLQFVASVLPTIQSLDGIHRHARDQLIRAAQSIPLNIAEGNGKRSKKDRCRFFEIARGSAMECAATLDVLVTTGGVQVKATATPKGLLFRVVSMLSRMTEGNAENPGKESA